MFEDLFHAYEALEGIIDLFLSEQMPWIIYKKVKKYGDGLTIGQEIE